MRWMLAVALLVGCKGGSEADSDDQVQDTDTPDAHWALSDDFLVIGHRGAALLAPENTLEGIEAARDAGTLVVEVDVQRTKDGVLVLLHDQTVNRTTDGTGAIQELTLAEAQALDAGYTFTLDNGETHPFRGQGVVIPTFEEALAAGADLYWDVEIKQTDPPIYDEVIAAIEAAGMKDRVFIAAFDDPTIQAVRDNYPDFVTNFGPDEYSRLAALTDAEEADYVPPGDIAQIPTWFLNQTFVDRAHRLGVKVHVWTVNQREGMEQALDFGVDGIITDDPATLIELLEERGL